MYVFIRVAFPHGMRNQSLCSNFYGPSRRLSAPDVRRSARALTSPREMRDERLTDGNKKSAFVAATKYRTTAIRFYISLSLAAVRRPDIVSI